MKRFTDYNEGEHAVFALFKDGNVPTQAALDEVLEGFLATRENTPKQHGYWVHALSHFTGDYLWKHKQYEWIKRLNLVALTGAKELGNNSCCDRLAGDLRVHGDWSMNPADFHFTPDMLPLVASTYDTYTTAYIAAAPFESEKAFLLWKANRPETYEGFDYDAQMDLVPAKGVQALYTRLKELGADTSELESSLQQRITAQLAEVEAKSKTALPEWQVPRIQTAIAKLKAALGQQ